MVRKKQLPSVDGQALAEFAKRFPGSQAQAATEEPANAANEADPPQAADHSSSPSEDDPAAAAGTASGPKPDPPAAAAVKEAPAAERPAEKAAPPPAARGGGTAALALLIAVVALVIAVAALAPPGLRPWLQTKLGENRIVDLLTGTRAEFENRFEATTASLGAAQSAIASHAGRLDEIEAVGGGNEAAARRVVAVENAIAETASKIQALDGSVAGLIESVAEQGRADEELATRVATLEEETAARVAAMAQTLEALERGASGPQRLFLMALKIRIAAESSAPFAADVAAAQAVAVEDEGIAGALRVLAAYAGDGVATHAQLRDDYNRQILPRLQAVERSAGPALFDQVGAWVGSLLSSVSGATPNAEQDSTVILMLAHENLRRGRLAEAIGQLEELDGPLAAAVAPWLAAAKARLAVDGATATLVSGAFDRLVAGG